MPTRSSSTGPVSSQVSTLRALINLGGNVAAPYLPRRQPLSRLGVTPSWLVRPFSATTVSAATNGKDASSWKRRNSGVLMTQNVLPECAGGVEFGGRVKRRFHSKQEQRQSDDGQGPRQKGKRGSWRRMRDAWVNTPIQWAPIPIGLGLSFLALLQLLHLFQRDLPGIAQKQTVVPDVSVVGPWQIHVYATLPLRSLSRVWGELNNLTVPMWLREPLYSSYAYLFDCNVEEAKIPDYKAYQNLGEFFYRELKDGVRPIDWGAAVVSPADGKVLNFGIITNRRIEQVKGFTYSLDALMGSKGSGSESERALKSAAQRSGSNQLVSEDHFANVNAIEYSLDQMLGDSPEMSADGAQISEEERSRLLEHRNHLHGAGHSTLEGNALFYTVIYLAPGDYHRFHSPTNWTVEKRRHCVGELFSVSPAMVKMLGNLFVLNERVVLLGNWQHGFFSMIPVGATNVGSIKINFDDKVKTNVAKRKSPVPIGTCIETGYANLTTPLMTASGALINPTKKGIPLNVGEEVGGFRLGSTVVLVFEAPADTFRFTIREGQKIKLGESIGTI